jgi:hypothetical protein
MARIDIKSTGTTLSDGVLQLENGVAMDATLRKVADQNNTTSPLLLSTALVQTTSTLKITTADNPYIDAEDNSGNNRFTVGRDPSSQQVNVDFASNPTGSTTAVGAIRTYGDGVNLSEAMTFREDGNVGINTTTPGAKLDVHSAANTVAQFNRTGTGNSQIQYLMTGTARWTTGYTSTAGNYSIYDNVNAVFRTNLSNTGKLTIGNGDTALTGQLNVKGSGATSATQSLLIQNSSGTEAFRVNDDSSFVSNSGSTYNLSYSPAANGALISSGTYPSFTIKNAAGINRVKLENGGPQGTLNLYLNGTSQIYLDASASLSGGDANYINSAVKIGANSAPDASAILELTSITKGLLFPRMTTAQKNAIATPLAGLMVYDTTLNKLCVYTTAWETITSI